MPYKLNKKPRARKNDPILVAAYNGLADLLPPIDDGIKIQDQLDLMHAFAHNLSSIISDFISDFALADSLCALRNKARRPGLLLQHAVGPLQHVVALRCNR